MAKRHGFMVKGAGGHKKGRKHKGGRKRHGGKRHKK